MKRFKFKLENVLNYRVTLETLAKNAYQEALRVLNLERETLRRLLTLRRELMKSYDIKAGTIVYPETLTFLARYTVQLTHLIEQQKKTVLEKEEIAKEKFEEWNRRRMDVKVIERLKEKRWKEYLREMDKEDQKFQDEIFIAKTIREAKGET
jgi:flagellar FliJ protein